MLYFFAPTEIDPKSTRDPQLKFGIQENFYHKHWGDSSIHRFTRTVSTLLSAPLPTLSIFVLYFVRSPPASYSGVRSWFFSLRLKRKVG